VPVKNAGPILVIEDAPEDFELLRLAFEQAAIPNTLMRCEDGDEALDYLRGCGPFANKLHLCPWPCLILLDLNLAGTDGREVLQALRRDPALRALPVMVLSTSNNPRDIRFCYAEGANCYAIKPIGLEKLEHLVALIRAFWLDGMELPPTEPGDPRCL
jgi:CheY-like chemotaxis protein